MVSEKQNAVNEWEKYILPFMERYTTWDFTFHIPETKDWETVKQSANVGALWSWIISQRLKFVEHLMDDHNWFLEEINDFCCIAEKYDIRIDPFLDEWGDVATATFEESREAFDQAKRFFYFTLSYRALVLRLMNALESRKELKRKVKGIDFHEVDRFLNQARSSNYSVQERHERAEKVWVWLKAKWEEVSQ